MSRLKYCVMYRSERYGRRVFYGQIITFAPGGQCLFWSEELDGYLCIPYTAILEMTPIGMVAEDD